MSAPDNCMYCGLPLSGEHDDQAHAACQEVVASDDEAAEITDGRELEIVEADLVSRQRCCWQIKPSGWDGTAIYCGQATDGAEFCPQHQAEADGDDETAAAALAERTMRLLAARAARPLNGGNMTAITGETVTHRAWNDWAEDSIGRLEALATSLDVMAATITDDDGDQAQITAIRDWQAQITDVAAAGRRMVADVNDRQVPVGEAVAAAGGPENTPNPEYADEAR